ncbi:MAG: hypothetical protein LAT57_10980 [Balneolales bacterium]|nr:hypothetical protein [Balneolales bacterium]
MTPKFTNYEEVEAYLLAMPKFSDVGGRAAHFALDQIRIFCDAIGNPERSFRSIHVAGTNGKGTVCSMLSAVFTSGGYKTGLFTSPHLIDVRERFRIDGVMISEQEMLQFFNEHASAIEKHPITFFELTTAIAFWYFAKSNVDIAIIETGLGGRLDATNIIDPELSIITSIGFDHTEQLGNTLGLIAREKAGIIKQGGRYILGELPVEALSAIQEHARSVGGVHVPLSKSATQNASDVESVHIQINTEMVLAACEALKIDFPMKSSQIAYGLQNVRSLSGLRGRLERMHPELHIYFDGAHNAEGLHSTLSYLNQHYSLDDAVVVTAMMKDKLTERVVKELEIVGRVYYFGLNLPRSASYEEFRAYFDQVEQFSFSKEQVGFILELAKTQLVLFTGSFYFYSIVSEWMESPAYVP